MPTLTTTAVAATRIVMDLQLFRGNRLANRAWNRLTNVVYPTSGSDQDDQDETSNTDHYNDPQRENNMSSSSQRQTSTSVLAKDVKRSHLLGAQQEALSSLEPIFAWLQTILLWHDPAYSFIAINGLTFMFLIVYNWAPRFYSTIMLLIFCYNFSKLWYCHIWPEIRVPPAEDHDVDRWTYLHPHLMTLPELMTYLSTVSNIVARKLNSLLELRENKPGVFCALVCATLGVVASLGSCLRGITIVYFIVIGLATAPGIYLHVLPENIKQAICTYVVSIFHGTQLPVEATNISPENDEDGEVIESRRPLTSSHAEPSTVTQSPLSAATLTFPREVAKLSKLATQDCTTSDKPLYHDTVPSPGVSASDKALSWINTGVDVSRSYLGGRKKSTASNNTRESSISKNSSSDDVELIGRTSSSCDEDEFEIISEAELFDVPNVNEDVNSNSGHHSKNLVVRYRSSSSSSSKSVDLDELR